MRLAIDVMGGDHAPDAILKGCLDALHHLDTTDTMVLVGPRDLIEDFLVERRIVDARLQIEHAPDVIEMGESAARAVRAKPNSSIVKLAWLGSHKAPDDVRCDAVLSAGNTGACVSAAIMQMKRLRRVHRPGIAVTIPAFGGPVVLIDAGANPEPKPLHLWQYALMADEYARHVLRIENPRVAQMNIGSEEGKGTELVKQTRKLLEATPGLNYIGYIEGREFFETAADVVVMDGFVGNTLLKMAEGLAKTLFAHIASEIFTANPDLAMQLEPIVKGMWSKRDYHEHGGAPLLGVNGGMLIAHGSSERRTIVAAVKRMREYVLTGVNDAIIRRLAEASTLPELAHLQELDQE